MSRLLPHGLAAALAALLLPALARGAGTELSVKPRAGATILGTDVPTGGLAAGLDGRVLFPLQEGLGVYTGAGVDAIGIQGGWYHMGVIAGPRVGGWYQWNDLYLSGGVGVLYGQLSTCRSWDIGVKQCMRWWNAWPEIGAHVGYRTKDVHIGADVSALILSVPWGTDVGLGLAASGSWR